MKTLLERFEEKYTPEPMSGCWLWTAGVNKSGYGNFDKNGKSVGAHRISWELHNGPIPKGDGYHGTCVLHKCDVPSCVNPDHLFLGSNQDNATDREMKGRGKYVRGEDQGLSILTEQKVRDIRADYAKGNITQPELANIYGVCLATINQVVTFKTWLHVT